MKYSLACIFSFYMLFMHGQTKPVEIVLDSIATDKSEKDSRSFHLYYHLKNSSGEPISFFLNTDSMIPLAFTSMSIVPHYELLQEGNPVDVIGIFTTGESSTFNIAEIIGREKNEDTIHAVITRHFDRMSQDFNNKLVNSVLRLSAGETQYYSVKLRWNLERYQKQDDNEYYLEENAKYEIKLSMHLLFEELKTRLTPEQYNGILVDESFIKGWFTSNAVKIDMN